jgi:hypothetical protein
MFIHTYKGIWSIKRRTSVNWFTMREWIKPLAAAFIYVYRLGLCNIEHSSSLQLRCILTRKDACGHRIFISIHIILLLLLRTYTPFIISRYEKTRRQFSILYVRDNVIIGNRIIMYKIYNVIFCFFFFYWK